MSEPENTPERCGHTASGNGFTFVCDLPKEHPDPASPTAPPASRQRLGHELGRRRQEHLGHQRQESGQSMSEPSKLSQFQALVTGAIQGSLMAAPEKGILIDAEVGVDENGDYTNEIFVTGRESGEKLIVTVERIGDA